MRDILILRDWRFGPEFPLGGIEGKVLSIARELAARRVLSPVLVTSYLGNELEREFRRLGFPVYAAHFRGTLGFRAARDIETVLKKHDVALMQSHSFRTSIVGRLVRRRHPEIPHVFRAHTYIDCSRIPAWRRAGYHLIDRWTARFVDRFAPICEFNRREMIRKSGIPAAKIRVVHNGIPSPGEPDPPVTDPHERLERAVAIIGRLEEGKQQHFAIGVIGKLKGEGLPIRLHLIGEGEDGYASRVREAAREHGVMDLVTFHGYRPRPFDLLRNVPVIALPSLSEGMPTVLIEGMATRKLVVGTPTGGTPELVEHGANGFLHPPDDAAGLADILRSIFTRPAVEWESMRNAGYTTWQDEFSVEGMMDGLIGIYRDLGVLKE